jgi:spermidine synthase
MLAEILEAEGMPGEAARHFEQALRLSPGDANLRDRYAVSLAMQGRTEAAAAELRRAIGSDPELSGPKQHLALLLATDPKLRDPAEALRLARAAAKLAGEGDPAALETLAAAYAATGDFDAAIREEQKAIAILEADGSAAASDARTTLAGYRRHAPLASGGPPAPSSP